MVNMWTADKIYYRNSDNFIRAYQGNELVWEKVQNNRIYYTTISGQVYAVSSSGWGTGVNVLSNTYINGQGVLVFNKEVTKIPSFEFSSSDLTSIVLPNSITTIGDDAFSNSSYLTSVNLPDSLVSLGARAFSNVNNAGKLTSINIPAGLSILEVNVFKGQSRLVSVTIPSNITLIRASVFENCTSLKYVYVESSVPPIIPSTNLDVFKNNAPGRKIYVPAGSLTAYQTATGWSDYASDIVAQ